MDIATDRSALEAWLILLRAPGFGPVALRELLATHGDATRALRAARRGALACTRDAACRAWLDTPDRARIDADLAWLAEPGHDLLRCDDMAFPALLEQIPSPPAALFVDGDSGALWQPQLAIVGSRNASHAGLANAVAFARALASGGLAITSGLADGIDGAAHAATLDVGGRTLAVLGTGIDLVYPAHHRELSARIARCGGALVSEFPPGTPAHPRHFPRRNRLIAGLALGTLVVEASLRSGSLLTARNAAESGREVFAIPGSIHNPLARGCHQLIRAGARLVETAGDVIAELAPLAQRLGADLRERLADTPAPPPAPVPGGDPDRARLLAALDDDPLDLDTLSARTALPVAAVAALLLLLELDGAVVATAAGHVRRRTGT